MNGRTYTYKIITTAEIPKTLTLYYIKKPRKATVAGGLGKREIPWFKFYLKISLIVTILTIIVAPIFVRL